jgi:hypothetical protein
LTAASPDITLSPEFVVTTIECCKLVFTFSFTFDGDNSSGGSRPPFLRLPTFGKSILFGVVFGSEDRNLFEFELLARCFIAVLEDNSVKFCCDTGCFSWCFMMSLLGECLAVVSRGKFSGLCAEEFPALSDVAGNSLFKFGVSGEC